MEHFIFHTSHFTMVGYWEGLSWRSTYSTSVEHFLSFTYFDCILAHNKWNTLYFILSTLPWYVILAHNWEGSQLEVHLLHLAWNRLISHRICRPVKRTTALLINTPNLSHSHPFIGGDWVPSFISQRLLWFRMDFWSVKSLIEKSEVWEEKRKRDSAVLWD